MKPPVIYNYFGKRMDCDALRGQGRRILGILETIMATGNQKQNLIRFIPYPGAIIIAREFFGTRIVDIYAGVEPPLLPQPIQRICICNCNLSMGWIIEVQSNTLDDVPLYNVMACNNDGTAYIPYPDTLASDFTKYVEGQKVLLLAYKEMAYICCTNKTGGENKVRGCTPYKVNDGLVKDDDDWRTIYRILPWCALNVPLDVLPIEWNPYG